MCKFDKRYQELFRMGIDLTEEEREIFNMDAYQGKSAGQEVDMQQSEFE